MDLGHENASSINFLERRLSIPASQDHLLGMLPASASPLRPHQYLYQILVETLGRKTISSSKSFNLSPRVPPDRYSGAAWRICFQYSLVSPSSRRALFHPEEVLTPGVSRGRGVWSGVRLVREREANIPAALIHLTWKRNGSGPD